MQACTALALAVTVGLGTGARADTPNHFEPREWSAEATAGIIQWCVDRSNVTAPRLDGAVRNATCSCVADAWRASKKAGMDDLETARATCERWARSSPGPGTGVSPFARKLRHPSRDLHAAVDACTTRLQEDGAHAPEWDAAFCGCAVDALRARKAPTLVFHDGALVPDDDGTCRKLADGRVPGEDGEAPARAVGVAECDRYLARMALCARKLAPEAYQPMVRSMRSMSDAWRDAATTPEGRAALATGCSQALAAATDAYKDLGCTF